MKISLFEKLYILYKLIYILIIENIKNLVDIMKTNSYLKLKEKFRFFSAFIIGIILILAAITSVAFYITLEKIKINSDVENIVLKSNIVKLDKEPEIIKLKSSGVIWTTRLDCGNITQNVNKFCIGELVYINGDKFEPNTWLYWNIIGSPNSGDQNSEVDTGYVLSND